MSNVVRLYREHPMFRYGYHRGLTTGFFIGAIFVSAVAYGIVRAALS